MKILKSLAVVLVLFVTVNAYSQWSYQTFNYGGGTAYGFKLTLDSTVTSYTSTDYDWTKIDGQTCYFNYSLVQAHFSYSAGNDTIQVILQGRTPWGAVLNLDTIGAGSAGSEIVVSGLTLSAGVSQYTIAPQYVVPMVRLYIARKNTGAFKNGAGAIFYGSIYSKVNDALYK